MATKTELRRLKQQVADSSHILFHQGLVDFHGHVSARIPIIQSVEPGQKWGWCYLDEEYFKELPAPAS